MPLQQHLQEPDHTTADGKKATALISVLGHRLEGKFQTYKSARYDKEREWERAIHQYTGKWDRDDREKIEQALSARGDVLDPITVNITRPKTNIAIARMQDIQFPTGGDFNFLIRPAPLAQEIKEALQQEEPDEEMLMEAANAGVPPDQLPNPAQMASDAVENDHASAPRMERALRARMIYANYGTKARRAIEDLCILGSAVVKGPTIQNRKQKRYRPDATTDGTPLQVLEESFIPEPSVFRVDPLLFYPDPSARMPNEIEDAFELHSMPRSELIELAKNPAFMRSQIMKLLDNDPDSSELPDIVRQTSHELSTSNVNNRYWVREYHGPFEKEDLYSAGMISEKERDDNAIQYTGEAWFADKVLIRVSLSHIEGEDGLPYGVTVWERDPNYVFGHGVPYLLRNAQRTVNSAYLMLLDNASLTSGPQIVLNKEMIEPANKGDYGIEPMKIWFMRDWAAGDVRNAMQFIDIPAQMQGIAQIMDTAMQFADVESSIPAMQQGDVPTGNNTTTGLAMIMSASNIVQKRASMNWDDYITKPLIHRFYHYEMQYGTDETVKGDFEIEVAGATERIEADIRAQEIERMLGLASSNEEFLDHVDSNKAFRALVDNTRTGDVLRSQEQVDEMVAEREKAAAEQQQADPAMMMAEAKMQESQARLELAKTDAAYKNQKLQQEMQSDQARYAAESQLAQARNNESKVNYQLGLAKLALEQNKTIAQIEKDMKLGEMNFDLKMMLSQQDFDMMEREIEVKNEFGTGI